MSGFQDEYPIKPLPAFLPDTLAYCNQANSEEELLSLLTKNTGDLLIFFEHMCDDETWSERHPTLVSNLIEWLTVQGMYDKLTDSTYKRTSFALRKHATIFDPFLPKNLTIQLKDGVATANSLLLTATAPFFKDAIRRQHSESNSSTLTFSGVTASVFRLILEFVNKGTVEDLWKFPEEEIIIVLRQAQSWGIDSLAKECQEVLERYITRDNVFTWIIRADEEGWNHFKQHCASFINKMNLGFKVSVPAVDRLKADFEDFSEETLVNIHPIQHMITDIACHRSVGDHRGFTQIITKLPKLLAVDLSQTLNFSDNFYSIPSNIRELDLSKCVWMSQLMLRKMNEICPELKRLSLANNQQLNFAAWGELVKFKQLIALNLSECQQISNDDLAVILNACRGVLDWNISECKKLTEKGFLEFTKKATRLTHLELSRTPIGDAALIELATRCRNLRILIVLACPNLTAKGVVECVKHAPVLQKLDISLCRIPKKVVEELTETYPYVLILYEEE